jgi:hypothetical protein
MTASTTVRKTQKKFFQRSFSVSWVYHMTTRSCPATANRHCAIARFQLPEERAFCCWLIHS